MLTNYSSKLIVLFIFTFCHITAAKAWDIIECPAQQTVLENVDFSAPTCNTHNLFSYQMSNNSVWLSIRYDLTQEELNSADAIGFFISGRHSAKVFIEGRQIGQKGVPSLTKQKEVIGPYDWVASIPSSLLSKEQVIVQMHISAFNNSNTSYNPFNRFEIGKYENPTKAYLLHYWPILIPLGVLLASLVYLLSKLAFVKPAKNSGSIARKLLLLVIICVAIAQLLVELYRGLHAYAYTMHDFRLGLITLLSTVFGHLILWQAAQLKSILNTAAIVMSSLLVVIFVQQYNDDPDIDAVMSIQIPIALTAALLLMRVIRSKSFVVSQNLVFAGILCSFVVLMTGFPHNFLDTYLYYIVASIVLVMLILDAYEQRQNESKLIEMRERADKLQFAIDLQKRQTQDQSLTIKEAGKLILIPVVDIVFCKGAGDYVEIVRSKEKTLYSGSIKSLSKKLPSSFLKVHRSYLVNARWVTGIKRLSSGNGELMLSTGLTIPVSRRLMPALKSSFEELAT